jgi:hypothetical protein
MPSRLGSPNKRTIQRALLERQITLNGGVPARLEKVIMATQTLEQSLGYCMRMTKHYKPSILGEQNPYVDEKEFAFWLRMTADFAAKLAPYQSPKLQAVYLETTEHKKAQDRPKTIAENYLPCIEAIHRLE